MIVTKATKIITNATMVSKVTAAIMRSDITVTTM
jgi:hypothetical protein